MCTEYRREQNPKKGAPISQKLQRILQIAKYNLRIRYNEPTPRPRIGRTNHPINEDSTTSKFRRRDKSTRKRK